VAITAMSARTAAAQAAVTAGGWPGCSPRSAARIAVALSVICSELSGQRILG
jgi:hypothetical protein